MPDSSSLPPMWHRGYQIVGAVAVGLGLALLIASASSTSYVGPQHTAPAHHRAPTPTRAIAASHGSDQTGLPTWFTITSTVLLVLFVAGVLLLVFGSRRGDDEDADEALRLPSAESDPAGSWDTLLAVDLAREANDQLAVLQHGKPRDAIIACWMGLQAVTRGAGMGEDPSETAVEFTIRAMAGLDIDRGATTNLSALYREARFSDHEMTEIQRQRAGESLRVVASQLAVAKVNR